MYIYMYTYTYVYIYKYVYTYIYTRTHSSHGSSLPTERGSDLRGIALKGIFSIFHLNIYMNANMCVCVCVCVYCRHGGLLFT